ncbi:uncharacterized protein PG986_006942 [Apiospora aurea]|uniref:Uncharacterized protein n=1 Tax=Apiospora aurea TaxID=335848 RepID=A0ABR1QB68_9PEZI
MSPMPCSTLFRQNGPSLVAYDPGYGLDIDTRAGGGKCAPGAVTTCWEQARLGFNDDDGHHTAASLGPLTCPDGWSTLASSRKDAQSTVAMCCPAGYTLTNGLKGSIKGDCRSTVSRGDVLPYAMTAYSGPSSWQRTTTTLTAGSFVGAMAVVGWNIDRREGETTTTDAAPAATGTDWRQSQGLPAAPTATGGSPGATMPTLPQLPGNYDLPLPSTTGSQEGQDQGGQQQQSGAGNSSSSSSSQDKDSGNATTIGVSVGVSLGAVALALCAAVLLVRRRRRRKLFSPHERSGGLEGPAAPPPAAEQQQQQQSSSWAELPAPLGRSRTDAGTKRRPSELPGAPYQRAVAELDGGWQR